MYALVTVYECVLLCPADRAGVCYVHVYWGPCTVYL